MYSMILGSEATPCRGSEVEGEETDEETRRRALNSARGGGAWDSRSLSIDCRRRAKAVM